MRRLVAALVAAVVVVGGCAPGAWTPQSTRWIIATTNFSETNLVAQMYLQALEAAGIEAEIKQLSNREVILPALEAGQVQITPEYLGSFTEFLNKRENGTDAPQIATGDTAATYAQALPLAKAVNVALLEPSPAQDQNAFAVPAQFAREHNLTTISDLAAYSQSAPITLGGPPECPQRPFCLPGLEGTYGASVKEFVPLDAGGPLTIQALRQGRVNVALVFSSSGSVAGNDLVVLTDDKGLQTAENLTPAVYLPAATPPVRQALDAVSAVLTTEALQEMNRDVEVLRKNPRRVAEDFLRANGVIPPAQ